MGNQFKISSFILIFPAFFAACSSSDGSGNFSTTPQSSSTIIESSSAASQKIIDYTAGTAMSAKLGKGINFGNTFDATTETAWGAGPLKKEQVDLIAKMGFKTARLPVRWDYATSKKAPYTIDPSYLARLKEVLGYFQQDNMRVIMDMHHQDSFIYDMIYPNETCNALQPEDRKDATVYCVHSKGVPDTANLEYNLTRIDSIWSQIAVAFSAFDNDFLLFEIFNEPVYGVSSDIYNTMIARTYPIIRASNPGRTLVYNTYPWGSASGISRLKLPEDGNIIIDIHYYDPNNFTHQGLSNTCDVNNPIIWEATSTNKNIIKEDFADMRSAANTYFPASNKDGIPILIGEFGVATCNNVSSKALWVRSVVENAELQNMSWQYWGFTSCGGFEIYSKDTQTWEKPVVAAMSIDTTELQ